MARDRTQDLRFPEADTLPIELSDRLISIIDLTVYQNLKIACIETPHRVRNVKSNKKHRCVSQNNASKYEVLYVLSHVYTYLSQQRDQQLFLEIVVQVASM